MDILNDKLLEAKFVFWGIRVYTITLDFIVGFMFSALIFQTVGVNLLNALAPAAVFAMFQFGRELRHRNIVKQFEGKYDGLDQRLQTAVEYQGVKNIIVDDLLKDVSARMDGVETSTFLNSKALSSRVWALVILSFLLLTITVLDLQAVAFDTLRFLADTTNTRDALQNLAGKAGSGFETLTGDRWEDSNLSTQNKDKVGANPGGERPGVSEGPIPGKGSGTGTDSAKDIYGDAKSANIAGNDVDFKLHPEYGGDIEIRETGGKSTKPPFQIGDVQSVDECAECVVGPEHEEVVRTYFDKILAPET